MNVRFDPDALELSALRNRSELRSEAYQWRVYREEARVAMLRMIPGLNFSAGINYTSDAFKANQKWYDASLELAWNAMSIFQGPKNIELAETQEKLSEVRRLALSMAVIAQVNVAELRFNAAKRDFQLADQLAGLETRIEGYVSSQRAAAIGGGLDELQAEVRVALANLRRDLAYADLQSAFGQIVAASGADPELEPTDPDANIMVVAGSVGRAFEAWENGEFKAPIRWTETGAD